jgi:hypothetical protein
MSETQGTQSCERDADLSTDKLCVPKPMSEIQGTQDCERGVDLSTDQACIPNEMSALDNTAFADLAPLLSGKKISGPLLCSHGGLFILKPWFEKAFNKSSSIIRQTAAQILLGEVNQEQAKNICFQSLAELICKPIRSTGWQRQLLDKEVLNNAIQTVWCGNLSLIGAPKQSISYCDPHVVLYQGKEKYLLTWSGLSQAPKKGLNLDFFHTINGQPFYIGHDDGYYDARQRFLMIVQQMRQTLGSDCMTFVQDRGFWGEAFMNAMIDMDLCFIQWEKNYQDDGWSDNYIRRGKTTIIRRKNNAKDRSKLRFYFREQGWEKHAKGRRIIVRTNAVNGKVREFSIVTNDPELSAEKIIELIFNRWIQEGDFSYENSHFGLDEQTSRKTNAYEQLAD